MEVIVIDDEARLSRLISDLFNSDGIKSQWFADSRKGLEAILKLKPRLVISDIKMSFLDGLALMKQVHSKLDIPFVFYSGESPYPEQFLLNAGAKRLFQKPHDLHEIFSYARSILEK